MQKIYHFVLAATIGAAAVLTTSCNGNNPNVPSQKEIETKIIGKWKRVAINGEEELTNHRQICTYETGGKAVYSESVFRGNHWVWSNHQEGSYTIDGNTLSAKIPNHEIVSKINSINDNTMDKYVLKSIDTETGSTSEVNTSQKLMKVSVDYSRDILGMWQGVEMVGDETYGDANTRIEYRVDGTYVYYKKDDAGIWQSNVNEMAEWNVDGDWLAFRWRHPGSEEENYEWWDIEYIRGNEMKWSALREKEDGTRFTTTFTWARVGEN